MTGPALKALAADREYQRLVRSSAALATRRAALPIGSSRASVTTANARWARAAEARDRREREVLEAAGLWTDAPEVQT